MTLIVISPAAAPPAHGTLLKDFLFRAGFLNRQVIKNWSNPPRRSGSEYASLGRSLARASAVGARLNGVGEGAKTRASAQHHLRGSRGRKVERQRRRPQLAKSHP
jgi:hypothetical protein